MNVVLTNAGLQAIVNAEQTGMAPVTITHIAFGSGQYEASKTQNALRNQIKRLEVISGGTSQDNSIHVAVQDNSEDSYSVYEFGVFLSDGTLLGVYSQTGTAILQKSSQAVAQFEVGIKFENIDVASVSFGQVSFSYPYGTKENPGIVELSTNEETIEGTDERRAVTPASLSARTSTASRTGLVQLATNAEAEAGTNDSKAVTPSGLAAALEKHTPESATESKAGIMQVATQTETNAGVNDTDAVTPKKLQNFMSNYSGDFSKANVKASGGNTSRNMASRFADELSPLDFGALGNGTADDTAAFTAFENAVSGRDVNLYGKTFSVTSKPTGNNYFNGFFKVGSVTVKPVYDFYKFGGTSERFLNIHRDFSEFSRGGGALIAADFIRKGSGGGNIVQSAIADPVNRYLYTLHVTGENKAVVNRFPLSKLGGGVKVNSTAHSLVSEYVGHQGLGIEYRAGGVVKLWGSFAYEDSSSLATKSKGTKAVRFNPPTSEDFNIDSGVEIFNLFPEVEGSSQACTVCVSYSGKYLIAKYNLEGNLFWVRVFRLADFTAAGDYSNKFIHEFKAEFTRDGADGIERALQGIACDDRFIYFLATGTGYNENHTIYVSDMFGNMVDEYRLVSVGKEIGKDLGTTFYEPESIFFMEFNGSPKLCLQIGTGETVGKRLCHIVALNARQSFFFPCGINESSFHGIGIDEVGRMINAEGEENFSLYPSGMSQELTARVGTCQKSLARFSDDEAGAAFNLFKSRGSKVRESKSVIPGDIIGQMNFLADNGNIDYEGTTQGARVGYIQVSILASSNASAAGNNNQGLSGVMRLFACEDGTSRAGEGLEIMADQIRPSVDNEMNNGSSTRRWAAVYAGTGTIQTSDENFKTEIGEIPEAVFKAWEKVQFVQFKFKDSEQVKGSAARLHIGLIAQKVVSAFACEGLNAFDYGLICSDTDKDGNEILSLRYDECLALECAFNRYRLNEILYKLNGKEN